jgi:hypothetical protein
LEQTSTCIELTVERVSKVLPQAQVTTHRRYEGWIPAFIVLNLSTKRNLTNYQACRAHTIALILLASLFWALCARAQALPDGRDFAPARQNLLAPLLRLAPRDQPAHALEIFERIHELDRKLILHPALSPQLQNVIDKLPATEVIPIEMPSLYASDDIPWRSDPPDAHYVAFQGRAFGADYIYSLSDYRDPPQQPGQLQGMLKVTPQPPGGPQPAQSVVAELKGSLYISDAMVPDRGMDAAAGFEREIYGTLAPPWDDKPGVFNEHDRAALARLRRDLPATSERLEHYLEVHNLLDEFNDPSGPWVLFNLDAEVKEAALAPFPHLLAFWRGIGGHVDSQMIVRDETGRRWMLAGFHRGHITTSFLLRRGMLTPMDAQMRPAGPPLPIEQIEAGSFYTENTASVQSLGMRFGLSGMRFLSTYENRNGAITFDGHMTDPPQLIAPRIIHPLTMLLAGKFLETIARGNGGRGMTQSLSALPAPHGGTMLSASLSAELRNAPALALLLRMAAALAPDYGAQVREEQRRLMAEFFDAFDTDYHRARPLLLDIAASPGS